MPVLRRCFRRIDSCGTITHLFKPNSFNNMEYKTYMCVICGFIYDEEKGWPDDGIAPGTRWEDVPLTWTCPDCGAGKDDFEMVEV